MAFTIKPFTDDLIPAVKGLNSRLTAGGAPPEFRFPENPTPEWLPKIDNRPIYREYFVLLVDDVVRGAYAFKHQDFSFRGELRSVGFFHWPISEGMVSKDYAPVALQMLRYAHREHPLLYGLGFGEYDAGPLPKILQALRWRLCQVPFHFKVNRPQRFLREIRALRKSAMHKMLLDLAVFTGTGTLALRMLQRARTERTTPDLQAERVEYFDRWADALWEECAERYAMIAVRDSDTLNILYPAERQRFLSYKVTRGGTVLGWVVLLDTPMQDNKYFGNLRVGSIIDCLALPENTSAVIRTGTRVLEESGVDVIVSNQSHAAWSTALRHAGFLAGPSNFSFAASKELAEVLHPFDVEFPETHFNRGDGDGPIHL